MCWQASAYVSALFFPVIGLCGGVNHAYGGATTTEFGASLSHGFQFFHLTMDLKKKVRNKWRHPADLRARHGGNIQELKNQSISLDVVLRLL